MTQPNAKPGPPSSAVREPSVEVSAVPAIVAPPTVALLATQGASGAANDDAADTQNSTRNPLWIIAVGMACLFGAMAAIMAVS